MQMTDGMVIHRALSRLKVVQRALAIKNADDRKVTQDLADAYVRIEELEASNRVEACKRDEARAKAENLQEEVEILKNQNASEVAARKSAESARRAHDSFANSYRDLYLQARAAWHNSQRAVNRRERELAAAKGDYSSLKHRLEEARSGGETDLLELDLMAERLVGEERPSRSLDGATPIEMTAERPTIENITVRRQEVEGPRVVGRVKPLSMSQAIVIEGGSVPGAQAELEGHNSAMPARVSVSIVRHKTQKLQARIRVFKMQEHNRMTKAISP